MGSPEGTPLVESHLLRKMFEKIYKTFVILIFCSNIYSIFLYVSLIIGLYDSLFTNIPNPYFYFVSPFILFPINFILALLSLIVILFRSTKDICLKLSIINFFIPIVWVIYLVIYITIDPTAAE